MSNPEARHSYDNPNPLGGFNPNDFFSDGFFNQFFRGPAASRINRGQNYNITLEISLYEAIVGVEKKINLKDAILCTDCNGSGFAKSEMCKACKGAGRVVTEQKRGMLYMRQESPCFLCKGRGQIPIEMCDKCKDGRIEKDRMVEFKVSPNTSFGDRMLLRGQGGKSLNGGPPGDLYVVLVYSLPKKEDLTEAQLEILRKVSSIEEAAVP